MPEKDALVHRAAGIRPSRWGGIRREQKRGTASGTGRAQGSKQLGREGGQNRGFSSPGAGQLCPCLPLTPCLRGCSQQGGAATVQEAGGGGRGTPCPARSPDAQERTVRGDTRAEKARGFTGPGGAPPGGEHGGKGTQDDCSAPWLTLPAFTQMSFVVRPLGRVRLSAAPWTAQHAGPPCPSLTPGAFSHSRPSRRGGQAPRACVCRLPPANRTESGSFPLCSPEGCPRDTERLKETFLELFQWVVARQFRVPSQDLLSYKNNACARSPGCPGQGRRFRSSVSSNGRILGSP